MHSFVEFFFFGDYATLMIADQKWRMAEQD